ncbi:response regulator [Streptomyces sp. IBSNAI002]|uniref:response regulator n=1 Tax=Streptomyces sp. IBSNAI002 TaxID=3457500 RepID=UPI003FD102E1
MADDEQAVLDGLTEVLRCDPDIDVVGCASSGAQALSLATVHSPDVLVIDLRMPDMGGLAVARQLREAGRRRPFILALTSYADQPILLAAWALGIRGLLLKASGPADLHYAVRTVAAGGVVVDSCLVRGMLDHLSGANTPSPEARPSRHRRTGGVLR